MACSSPPFAHGKRPGEDELGGRDKRLQVSTVSTPHDPSRASEYSDEFPTTGIEHRVNVLGSLAAAPPQRPGFTHQGSPHSSTDVGYDTCFGMVRHSASGLRLDALEASDDECIPVSLKFRGTMVTLQDPDTMVYVGMLNRETAEALWRLSQRHVVTFSAFVSTCIFIHQRSETTRPRTCQMELHILIYGFRANFDSIGTMLSDACIYLQPPHNYNILADYLNPHYLTRHGASNPVPATRFPSLDSRRNHRMRDHEASNKQNLVQIFDSACGPLNFAKAVVSDRIATELKGHQMKALSMMLEKEAGRLEGNEFPSLWETVSQADGQRRYRNVVTCSTRSSEPRNGLGGVIADEMGLGKTLTCLALVATSLDMLRSARSFNETNQTFATLVVVPVSLLSTWIEQIRRHMKPDCVSWCLYHGKIRAKTSSDLMRHDIVLTTYETILSEWMRRPADSASASVFYSWEWHRIVLDEAHYIRNASSKRHAALRHLKARYRWCLTGSPIQNRVEDFGALLSFLRIDPFDSQSFFQNYITSPIQQGQERGLVNLRRLVISTCLRRTKASIFDDLQLTPRRNETTVVQLNAKERHCYEVLRGSFQKLLHAADEELSIRSIFLIILRLRQFCNHALSLLPPNILALMQNECSTEETSASAFLRDLESCEFCLAGIRASETDQASYMSLRCAHILCPNCASLKSCPSCIIPAMAESASSRQESAEIPSIPFANEPSSKIVAFLNNLKTELTGDQHGPTKSVVFTSWRSTLDLVERSLKAEKWEYERIDGSKRASQRAKAIEKFRLEPSCRILLATIGSAGVGLDLTVASCVHLLEPQWNPMAEEQALDRVHRIGQSREVIATRYVVQNSIEEYVIAIRKNKSDLISQTFTEGVSRTRDNIKDRLKEHLSQDSSRQ